MTTQIKRKRVLSVFSLVMINIIAIDSLRSLPINAEYGFSILFFYLIAGIGFLIPCALVTAELATQWPKTGGSYVWVREAFGRRWGFMSVWLLWIYNVVWYPTLLTFITTSFAFLFFPHLIDNRYFMSSAILIVFGLATLLNWFGMRLSSIVSSIGAIFGTLIPMFVCIVLGIAWIASKQTLHIHFTWHHFLPSKDHLRNITFFVAVIFSLVGIEMSAVHAEEVKNPEKNYPRALLISVTLILLFMTLSSLAVAVVLPANELNIVNGLNEAFARFFKTFHLHWMLPIIEMLIILGGFAGLVTWVIGPTKGLLVAAEDKCLPKVFTKRNKHASPVVILMIQFFIVAALSSLFLFMPSISSTYWFLTDLTAQLALLYYLTIFAAAIRLRYKFPKRARNAFLIPGGKMGIWIVGLLGIFTCLGAISVGLIPPENVKVGSVPRYEALLIVDVLIVLFIPLLITLLYDRRSDRK